jgi:four helix bundle protein
MNYLQLNDISCYKKAYCLSNYVWNLVIKWDFFSKKTIGEQFVNAIDSISANVAEGFGRFGKKEKIRFYRISAGSAKESLDWNEKARVRKLLEQKDYDYILKELQEMPRELNQLIKFTNEKLKE